MPRYRAYPLDAGGKIADSPIMIDAAYDGAALAPCKRRLGNFSHEVWEGARLVGVMAGKALPSDDLSYITSAFAHWGEARRTR